MSRRNPVPSRTAAQRAEEQSVRDRKMGRKPTQPVVGRWSGRKYGGNLQDQVNQLAAVKGKYVIPHNTGKSRMFLDMETHSGMTLHNAEVLPGVFVAGAIMGSDEYKARPLSLDLADYVVRNGGIYLRRYNVRLATFAPNNAPLPDILAKIFDAAFADKQAKIEKFRVSRMSVNAQIKYRQEKDRKAYKGWYVCQCGQWVHDKTCPCSVCSPERAWRSRKSRKKK